MLKLQFSYKLKNYSFLLVFYTLLLSGIGVYLIGSVAPYYRSRQVIGIGLGVVAMGVLSVLDFRKLAGAGVSVYLAGMGMLLAVNAAGAISGGAARWIEIGGFRFQPSELGKILFILFFAWLFGSFQESLNTWRFLLLTAVLMAIPVFSVLRQPDLSTSIVIAWTFLCMLFMAGLSYRIILGALAVAFPIIGILLFLVTRPEQAILSDYQHRRIMAWLSSEAWAEESYQQRNSIMAIGSGGLLGNGAAGEDSLSVIGSGFLPEPHTDFIMAVAGETLGFAGSVAIIVLLLLVVLECVRIGSRAINLTGRLICIGMAALIGGQAFVNLGVVSGILPNTGLTLPFVSYGLTSLVSLYMGLGLVLNVGLHGKRGHRIAFYEHQ